MSDPTKTTPLRMRLPSPEGRLRVLQLTHEDVVGEHPGQRDGFAQLARDGEIETFTSAAPIAIASSRSEDGALRDLLEIIRTERPNVIVQDTPRGFPYTEDWFRAVASGPSRPILLYWEGDAWGRWTKPVRPEMRLWWRAADVVFTVAIGAQKKLIERLGGRDVRFVPNTYDHILYRDEEATEPSTRDDCSEVAVIGNWLGHRYLPSRLPGARQRFQLVRGLQDDPAIPLAIYGENWSGRGVKGPIHYNDQARVARTALVTANWDHYPDYAGFYSNRLPSHLLAGRAHVTTRHASSEWLPGPETGLFLERTVNDAVGRVRELLARPREEVLELGLAAHRWARHRLSDRESVRYMLGAVDERLLAKLPEDPWRRLP
jgi:hypothetical protein